MTRRAFNVMAFPSGPLCNLSCEYCYYLDKIEYYRDAGKNIMMTEDLLEQYIQQYIAASPGPYIDFGWQGGEPTLRGLDFYRRAIELQKKHLPQGWRCQNSFQTNAVLLDEEWCQFFSDNGFLVGVSLDGPQHLHDRWRKNKNGQGSHEAVLQAIRLLQKYKVEFNILCVVNSDNAKQPLETYSFFKDLGIDFVQFIPLVESGRRETNQCSVLPEDYGAFLIKVFNEWVQHDIGKVFVQMFEEVLKVWVGQEASLCIFSQTCGNALVMEHNGDLYSCDHFVQPENLLGNIQTTALSELVNSQKQWRFGQAKQDLAAECLECPVRFICQGGCPKNRISETTNGEKINYLCAGYKQFFSYVTPFMEKLGQLIIQRCAPDTIQSEMISLYEQVWSIGRNEPCPCGSGKKYKRCCLVWI